MILGGKQLCRNCVPPQRWGEIIGKSGVLGGNEVFLEGKFSKSVPPKRWGELASNRVKLWEGNIKISPSYGGEVPPPRSPPFHFEISRYGGEQKVVSLPPPYG